MADSLSHIYLHFSEHPSPHHLPDRSVGSLLSGEWLAFLVTSSNSFLLPITAALDLSGLSCSQLERIQAPISAEQEGGNDTAVSQPDFWDPGRKSRAQGNQTRGPAVGLLFTPRTLSPSPSLSSPSSLIDDLLYFAMHQI